MSGHSSQAENELQQVRAKVIKYQVNRLKRGFENKVLRRRRYNEVFCENAGYFGSIFLR